MPGTLLALLGSSTKAIFMLITILLYGTTTIYYRLSSRFQEQCYYPKKAAANIIIYLFKYKFIVKYIKIHFLYNLLNGHVTLNKINKAKNIITRSPVANDHKV